MINIKLKKFCKFKYILILSLLFQNTFAATKSKTKETDIDGPVKTYSVSSAGSQLKFDDKVIPEEKPETSQFFFDISRNWMTYSPITLVQGVSSFKEQIVGVEIGKQWNNVILRQNGFLDFSVEWQTYQRTTSNDSQDLNVFAFKVSQNFYIMKLLKNSVNWSIGAGVSPVFSTLSQSSISDSESNLGILFSLKTDFVYPMKKNILGLGILEGLNLGLSGSVGEVGSQQMSFSTIKFETLFNF